MTHSCGISYAFAGSGRFAARCLELLAEWREPSWLITAPPRPAGRGRRATPTPFADMAERLGLLSHVPLVSTPSASKDEAVLRLKSEVPVTFVFVTDFGQLVKEPLLDWGEHIGCLNIHPSLLPLYRGAAPVQRALMDGARKSGVTIFKLAHSMDSGPVLLQCGFEIGRQDNAGDILERAALLGTEAFIKHAERVSPEEWSFTPQDEASAAAAPNAPKISKEEERIDWSADAESLHNKIRALAPEPGAWSTVRGKRIRVLAAYPESGGEICKTPGMFAGLLGAEPLVAAGRGLLRLVRVQMEGKRAQPASEWWNGLRASEGECLS